ncbi:FeoC-like transcriptional regulator [Halobaculum saliterrae]|uniref:FeoC-like transcriptional regulator n=1 Tax=Halobaculum saliterrae TaxID=2073113 RepID=UPI001916491D|nr:FeoC-like transcriptional regulator [Halobaculum saliterrae]
MTAPRDSDPGESEPDAEQVYETMDPLEPYTTGELASILDASKRVVRGLLDALAGEQRVRKKKPESERVIWIREPPKHRCGKCGGEFEVKYVHPIFQAVQFCPKCGTQLRTE